jgi:hypothetical protein
MFTASSGSQPDPAWVELVQFSSKALSRKAARSPFTPIGNDPGYTGAPPLMPLRDRDIAMMDTLFHHDDIAEIEADILHGLLQRYPEPCWEDDTLDWLG